MRLSGAVRFAVQVGQVEDREPLEGGGQAGNGNPVAGYCKGAAPDREVEKRQQAAQQKGTAGYFSYDVDSFFRSSGDADKIAPLLDPDPAGPATDAIPRAARSDGDQHFPPV